MAKTGDVFERFEVDGFNVFRDKSKLSLGYVPDVLVSRKREEEYFAKILVGGVRDGFLPSMIRVSGPPGSGKTSVVCSVMERFQERYRDVFRFFYVNLKGSRTVFMAGNAVLGAISGRRVASNLGLDRLFGEIWKELGGLGKGFVCLVLDEVESVFLDKHYDPNDFFYRLVRYRNYLEDVVLCSVLISNDLFAVESNFDARVRSSMGREEIVFHPYSVKDIQRIVDARIVEAFKEDVFSETTEIVSWFFDRSVGDARGAIEFLRLCGEIANDRRKKIDMNVCSAAWTIWEDNVRFSLPGNLLAPQLNVLLQIAFLTKQYGRLTSGDLYTFHRNKHSVNFDGGTLSKLSSRSILDTIMYFESVGLVRTWNVSKGRRGYGKEIRLNADPDQVISAIKNKGITTDHLY